MRNGNMMDYMKSKKKYRKSFSLYPLKPEKALSLFIQVKPERKRKANKRIALSSV